MENIDLRIEIIVAALNLLFIFFWVLQSTTQILKWIYWIQVKEYRFDRFKTLFFNRDGRVDLDIYLITAKIGFLLLSLAFNIPLLLFSLVVVYLGVEGIVSIFKRSLRIPVLTKRTFRIITLSLIIFLITLINLLFFVKSQSEIFITILFGEVSLIVGPAVGVMLTGYLVSKTKLLDIKTAKEKIAIIDPKIIGVTGSYGKTTTKEFIFRLLSSGFNVSKTPGSHNTEFGLARSIINNLKKGDKFFVAEYGAYKIGEINKLTEIARPDIAVITAVEQQHIEIFGSLENISKAKYELVQALPENGTAIFNIGNKKVKKLYDRAKKERSDLNLYSYQLITKQTTDNKADIKAEIISINKSIKFIIKHKNESKNFEVTLPSVSLIENLLPAILISRNSGINWNKISLALKNVSLPEGTLNVIRKNNIVIIDDSHNSSPTGFITAIEFLGNCDGIKFVVTPGIIELGTESKNVHTRLATELNKIDIRNVYLTKVDPFKYFKNELGNKAVLIKNTRELEKIINENKPVVLLEGRVPGYVMKHFRLN